MTLKPFRTSRDGICTMCGKQTNECGWHDQFKELGEHVAELYRSNNLSNAGESSKTLTNEKGIL